MRINLFIIIYFFALFFCLSGSENSLNLLYNKDSKIFAFGDSLTYGYGSHTSYPQYLSKILNVKVNNLGINGEKSLEGLNRLKKIFSKQKADIIILMHGGNDFLQKQSKHTKKNLGKMIKFLKSKNIRILFIGIPKSILDFYRGSNKIYKQLAIKYTIIYDNYIISKLLQNNKLKSDRIHFNANGYKKLANKIANYFKKEK